MRPLLEVALSSLTAPSALFCCCQLTGGIRVSEMGGELRAPPSSSFSAGRTRWPLERIITYLIGATSLLIMSNQQFLLMQPWKRRWKNMLWITLLKLKQFALIIILIWA